MTESHRAPARDGRRGRRARGGDTPALLAHHGRVRRTPLGRSVTVARLSRSAARWWAWLGRHPDVTDTVLALFLLALAVPRLGFIGVGARWPPDTVAVLLVVAGTAPLALRRRRPATVLAVVSLVTVLHRPLTGTAVPDFLAVLIAVWTVGALCPPAVARTANGVALVVVPTALLPGLDVAHPEEVLRNYVLFAIVWALGNQHRRGAEARVAAVREREARLNQQRESLVREAAAAERLRLARDLHDVVAHHVTLMVVQADTTRRGEASTLSPRTARTLESVCATGRQAMTEMRRLLAVIDVTPTPQPVLDADLAGLLDRTRAAGLSVDLRTRGVPVPLPPTVAAPAYRVVQEALTNALRHAGPQARVGLTLAYDPGRLTIRVVDEPAVPGPRPADPGVGRGLAGMRDRVTQLGGTVRTGPTPPGGFEVVAHLPLPATPDGDAGHD